METYQQLACEQRYQIFASLKAGFDHSPRQSAGRLAGAVAPV